MDTRFPEEVRRRVFPVVGRSLITNFGLTLRSCRARYRGKKLSVLRENLKTDRKHFSRKRPKRNSRTVARKKLRRYQKCFRAAVVVDDANALELFFTISVCSGGIQVSSSPENSSPANSKQHFFILHSTEAEPDSVEASNPLFPEFEYSTTAAGTRIPYLLLIARRGENELVCDKKEGVVNDHRTLTNGPRDY